MILKKNDLIWKCGCDVETAKLIVKYQKTLPILTEQAKGFCINARDLHNQLGVGRDFSTWIKGRIKKYNFKEEVDFTIQNLIHQNGGIKNNHGGDRKSIDYILTLDMAKELSMVENNENGMIARKYFISCEKILRQLYEWDMIRHPEKKLYKDLCSELKSFLLRNYNKEAKFYDYSNEADALNVICLGAKAKDIREYIEAQDKNTRDWLEKQYNEYILKIEELDIMYLKMNMDKERRYDLLKQGFKALYPNASFIIANSDIKRNIEEGKYL